MLARDILLVRKLIIGVLFDIGETRGLSLMVGDYGGHKFFCRSDGEERLTVGKGRETIDIVPGEG
jgi:hypothetical protein